MAALVAPFTKAELLDELRTTLFIFARELGRMYTFNGAFRLLGLEPPVDGDGPYSDPFVSAPGEPCNDFDLSALWVTDEVEALYDFAFEGRHAAKLDWSVIVEDVYPFLRAVEAHEAVVSEAGMPRRLRHVLELAVARAVVNGDCDESIPVRAPEREEQETRFGGYLPLRQVALLAGVDEKTVRNAAVNPKATLKSKSIGGRTYFDAAAVRKWLEDRGQWLPTVMVHTSTVRDLKVQPFTSNEDMFAFVSERAREIGLDWNSSRESGERPVAAEALAWLVTNRMTDALAFNFDHALAVAAAIQVPADAFVPAVLDLAQRHEQARIQREIESRMNKESRS